jgi:hypothetical protein
MALPTQSNLLLNPTGSPYDPPADADCLIEGQGASMFSLLKGILAALLVANEAPSEVSSSRYDQ